MLDLERLKEEQLKLAKKVVLKDELDTINIVAGVDNIFFNGTIICSIVLCDYGTMAVKEQACETGKTNMPYISGFRAYREGKAITEAYLKLKQKPTIMMFSGNGILHPRRIGLASHMGILLDAPTIGVAKKILCGERKKNKIIYEGKIVGEAVLTREHSNPIYVSPGHKMSLKTSVEIVRKCIRLPHKLPEPLHLAHKQANEVKDKIFSGSVS